LNKILKNIKFYENQAIGSRVIPCRWTDMTKLIVAFRNFADAPKNAGERMTTFCRRAQKCRGKNDNRI